MQQIWSKNEQLVAAASEARAMKDAAAQREEAYRQLSGRLLHLQDEERRRLALDLHDSTGQLLAALIMNLGFIERAAGLGARSRKALSESRSLAERCSREVRTLTYLLYPPLLDEAGLLSAVRWYVAGFEKRSGIHVHVHLDEIGRLPSPVERSFFRVVQESLTNVHRHASTTTASIRLTRASSLVVLEVSDTGRGLEGASAKPVGVGIIGMRERVRQVGGTFDVTFSETGTTVRATVPEGPP
jgi:signal transduction histidine kinase